ncbi:MAG: glyoxalase [Sphingobacterium sp.]|jgi:PhnB protein|uniref:glyoxalase n=1 Tax=unclassified Sphingobacterium TaxID=2609468 RepID=UPI0009852F6B|nr:glyoxalase [Sphingobacterium sp. CZ-UAM]MDF2518187.1 glyoxalase [Sphingobacterium sp.]OOG17720.1 glyoxalase [Sphingobacterium sp. CZ-UAM]
MEGLRSGVFITFSGNCRKALTFYQSCFGGSLEFDILDKKINGYAELPIVSASLISPNVVIYGSDLVHDDGRKIGNYLSVFLSCTNVIDRGELVSKLTSGRHAVQGNNETDPLIEVTDIFDVRWILGIQ